MITKTTESLALNSNNIKPSNFNKNTINSTKNNKNKIDISAKIIFMFCASIAVIAVILITAYMVFSGGPAILKIGVGDFIFGQEWKPTAGDPKFGILPLILSSVYATLGAIVIGVPVGILVAVYIVELAPKWLTKILKPAIELLAGIPSVIYGLIGMMVIVPFVAKTFDLSLGACLFSAIIILAIMILPTVISITETGLRSVPIEYKEASLGLGATQIQTIFKVQIPAAKSTILTGVVLGIGRAVGETMAVIMVAGNAVNMPKIFESVRFLTTGIVSEMSYSTGLHRQALFGIGLVLFLFIMIINIVLTRLIKSERK
ncbi:MAG: phosphate transporter permease subunit PstC [Clostridiales bacterium]|jgi:phosphate transport system permease protein|nr:phosphate transporter permease subunit PstC [Clostridiales bacterium]